MIIVCLTLCEYTMFQDIPATPVQIVVPERPTADEFWP